MIVKLPDATLMNVWAESFKSKSGEEVEYYRALVNVPGEAPLQLKVSKDDFEGMREMMGMSGCVLAELDCTPGNRQSVYMKGME